MLTPKSKTACGELVPIPTLPENSAIPTVPSASILKDGIPDMSLTENIVPDVTALLTENNCPEEPSKEMNEYQYIDDEDDKHHVTDEMIESMFTESKIDKIIKGYFVESKAEKKGKVIKESVNVRGTSKKVQTLSETKRQEESARNFVKNNPSATLIGKSSKNNLLFENNGKTVKVTTNGRIL